MQILGDLESEIQNLVTEKENQTRIKEELFELKKDIEVKDKITLDRNIKLCKE